MSPTYGVEMVGDTANSTLDIFDAPMDWLSSLSNSTHRGIHIPSTTAHIDILLSDLIRAHIFCDIWKMLTSVSDLFSLSYLIRLPCRLDHIFHLLALMASPSKVEMDMKINI